MPKFAVAGWHYTHRTLVENAEFFLANGFDVFSALGKDFVSLLDSEREAEALAEVLVRSDGGLMTVHYGLPDPKKSEDVDSFFASLERIALWQKTYGQLHILSFDVWFPDVFPLVSAVVRRFSGSGTKIAFEDYCLGGMDEKHRTLYAEYPFYELLDAGHMNFRLYSADKDASLPAFRRAVERIDLPIIETHIHNNRGIKDMHAPLLDPTLCAEKTGTFDTEQYFTLLAEKDLRDIIITVETMPFLYGQPGVYGDASVLNDLKYVRTLAEKTGL